MIRNAFTMKLKPGCVEEYKRRHDTIWPELALAHTEAGIFDYLSYLDEESSTLIAFQKLTDDNMADLMETHPDNMPIFKTLHEIFHMNEGNKND